MAFSSSLSIFPPPCHHHLQSSKSIPLLSSPLLKHKTRTKFRSLSVVPKVSSHLFDPLVLQIAEALEDSHSSHSKQSPILQKLRDLSAESALSCSWPTRKDESYKTIDISSIKNSQISSISHTPANRIRFELDGDDDAETLNIVIVDGHIIDSKSNLDELPDNVYVGGILGITSDEISEKVMKFVSNSENRDLFWSLNGIGAPDVTIVYVPTDCIVEKPLRFKFYSQETSEIGSRNLPMSNPRVLVLVDKGGEVGIVEEYLGSCGGCKEEDDSYWVNSVMEVQIGEGGKVVHTYLQQEAPSAAHFKWTAVRQESCSTYNLVEVSTGGKLSRHNLHIQQLGPDTFTEASSFHVCVRPQIQDLHSNIILDHPRGFVRQRHKGIGDHSRSRVVCNGNIVMSNPALKTDYDQVIRGLLLVDGATAKMEPRIQANKNEVKRLSHGSNISGIDNDELFYLCSRGMYLEAAKKALAFAFGCEVMYRLPYVSLRKKVESLIRRLQDRTPS
ncbi:hypothetical protein C5167_004550 [Papaver somniferum]|uniref:Uncharacterized protein n=1 Tax=Papaver somniferum TaxID=3469 RepID=A0A4Y7J8V1_PAPSO|nr:protein ABCI7, chloroplastic-like [Papaver somniferum]RZC57247.1 hypothetical protein C5167_004550 [Papaver somniferum]